MTPTIFDTHAHYCADWFDADRDEVLAALPGGGVVGVCEQATHSGDAPAVLALAERYPYVWAAIGIHPESLLPPEDCPDGHLAATVAQYGGDWRAELKALRPYYDHPRVVAVGECGLDHHWPVDPHAQYEMFEAHLQLAAEIGKPVVIHDRQAHGEVYDLLRRYRPRGVVHAYSGSAEDVPWLTGQGLYLGFGGACTWKGAKRALKALAACPLDKILLETDCPYMAPQSKKGQRNDSRNLTETAELIAQVKDIPLQEVYAATLQNACDFYGLPR